jgi:hypothetical protein
MRKLRKLADRTGGTVQDLIHEGILEFVAKPEVERDLETKIIRFPKSQDEPPAVGPMNAIIAIISPNR